MNAALALAERGRGRSWPNPNVGCLIVAAGRVVGRGWTRPGGRPHAEAAALEQAGARARGATAYVTLEPCAHKSERGPSCAPLLAAAGVRRVVCALEDPDPRTAGRGFALLEAAGVALERGIGADAARHAMAGWLIRQALGRPHVTLKLATSLDGRIAMADGRSRWITGEAARGHAHLERARADAILVGRGTYEQDAPSLDVRLPGLADRSPIRVLLTCSVAPAGWQTLGDPRAIGDLAADWLLVEGGAQTAAAFLAADLVDRLLLYRAPILIGDGTPALGNIGLGALGDAHHRWRLRDARAVGVDRVEDYERVRE